MFSARVLNSAGAALVVAGLASVSVQASAEGEPSQAAPSPSSQSAQIVVRDAETGALRAPTSEEARALQSSSKASRAAAAVPMTKYHSSGAQGARLTDEFMSYSVAVRQPDGKVATACVDSRAEAESTMKAAPVSKAAVLPTE